MMMRIPIACPRARALRSSPAVRVPRTCCRSTARRSSNDPALAAARAHWEATQERVPQARARLLPSVSARGHGQRRTTYD